jgi:hypothetical protein
MGPDVQASIESQTRQVGFFEKWYGRLNVGAVTLHLVNCLGLITAYFAHNQHIKAGYVFVSPKVPLRWTNHALVLVNSTDNKCSAVSQSPHFQATVRHEASFPPREPFSNFMGLFDFTGTDIIEYDLRGAEIDVNVMLIAFCALSFMFQATHQLLLLRNPDMPRFLHYLEYSFSSSLMAMTMAVEVGIVELFSVVGIGGLFYGMNIAGMGAEILAHYANIVKDSVINYLCLLMHVAGWVMFFMAMVPIWAQFYVVLACSENGGTPTYIYALIIVESFGFFVFGFLQVKGLYDKIVHQTDEHLALSDKTLDDVTRKTRIKHWQEEWVELLFKYDCAHALLSVVAKTILVWLLVAPMLTVDVDALVDRKLAYL